MADGVSGTEISIYLKDYNSPEVKITFLHLENDIYEDVLKLFIRKDCVGDLDVEDFLNWVAIEMKLQSVEKVNEVYQVVQGMLIPQYNERRHVRNYETRQLNLNPPFQVKLPHPNYKEYIKGE